MCCSFNFDEEVIAPHLRKWIPNKYQSDPGMLYSLSLGRVFMRGMVLVTTEHVQDEELLMNYRYNPMHPYPAWYHQPDEEEARRRWSKPRLRFML
jgi:hypothetical protein